MTPEQIVALIEQIDPAQVSQIADQLGIDPVVAGQIVERAMPTIMAGMAGNAAAPSAADMLNSALDADHDGSILNDLSGYLGHPDTVDGQKILGHVFGAQQSTIAKTIAQQLGLDPATVSTALTMLAPIVMGYLGRQRQEGSFDASQLADLLPALGAMIGGDLGALLGGQR